MKVNKNQKLPTFFKPLFWGYNFNSIDIVENKRLVIVNTLNYGNWKQWQWLVKQYGRNDLKKTIINIPKSEFRKHIIKLLDLLFNIKEFKYASRSAQTKAKRNL